MMIEKNINLMVTCPDCGCTTDEIGYCENCDIIIDKICPECGDFVWTDNDPGKNYGAQWCNSCDYFQNTFILWEDVKESY